MAARLPFNEQLRALMDDREVSVKELADCVDVSLKTVYDWLKGPSKPRDVRLQQIAYCLAADYDELALAVMTPRRQALETLSKAQVKEQMSILQARLKELGEDP